MIAACAVVGATSTAHAQDKAIHVVVPLLAGSGTDVVTRTFVAALSQRLGQPIVVENKAGGATTLGAHYVAKSIPDGLTLLRDDHTLRLPTFRAALRTRRPGASRRSRVPLVFGAWGFAARALADLSPRKANPGAHLRLERYRQRSPTWCRAARRGGSSQFHARSYKGGPLLRGRDRGGGFPCRRARLDGPTCAAALRALVVTAAPAADAAQRAHGGRSRMAGAEAISRPGARACRNAARSRAYEPPPFSWRRPSSGTTSPRRLLPLRRRLRAVGRTPLCGAQVERVCAAQDKRYSRQRPPINGTGPIPTTLRRCRARGRRLMSKMWLRMRKGDGPVRI